MALIIEPLAAGHDRARFSCGQPELDDWFARRARQDAKRDVARVFVAVDAGMGVVGFYTLSAFTIASTDLPFGMAKKVPRYDALPAALIGRLARDLRARGRAVGELLLADAVRRCLETSRALAIHAIVVEAKDDLAAQFYSRFGFQLFPSRSRRLFLTLADAQEALERA